MPIISPIPIDTIGKVILSYDKSFEFTDHEFAISMMKKISMVSISKTSFKSSNAVDIQIFNFDPTEQQLLTYVKMQNLIKSCADNAEYIKDQLLTIIISLFPNDDRKELMKLDFMKLKDRFMDYLKKDVLIKTLEQYNSNQKLKPFRQNFNSFVLDRNIYTHGLLCILRPDFNYIIEYIDNFSKNKTYAYITIEMLQSYNKFYQEILQLIAAFRKTRQIGSS
jgi:hypothetical protein